MKMRNVLTGCDFSKSATTTAGIPFSFFWAGLTGIADLQDFIDRSLEVPGEAEFTLVYGLLYDQIDRLPIGWAQKAVIRLFERTEAIISGVCVFYWSSKLAIRVPPSPRSISYIKPLASLRELLQRTRLKWRNFSNVRGFFSAAIWVNFCTSEQDLRAWQETLGVDPKNFGLPSRYYAFPLYRISLALNEAGPDQAEQLVSIYRTSFPEHSGVVPLYLLQQVVFAMTLWSLPPGAARYLTQCLKVIENHRTDTVDEEWLKDTSCLGIDYGDKTFDLFVAFRQALRAAIQNDYIPDDELSTWAYKYASQLQARRDELSRQ